MPRETKARSLSRSLPNRLGRRCLIGAMSVSLALAGSAGEDTETSADSPAKVVHFERSQNLAATNPLGCVDANTVTTQSTAADIASGVKACLEQGDYERLGPLLMVASAYARYDTLRVTDTTAHAALTTLFADRFADASETQVQQVLQAVDEFQNDPDRHQEVCKLLGALGPPEYRPDYMIAHGIEAFLEDSTKRPVREIDSDAGWRTALEFVNCEH